MFQCFCDFIAVMKAIVQLNLISLLATLLFTVNYLVTISGALLIFYLHTVKSRMSHLNNVRLSHCYAVCSG